MNRELYELAIKDIEFNRYFMATGGGYDLGLYGNDKLEFVITRKETLDRNAQRFDAQFDIGNVTNVSAHTTSLYDDLTPLWDRYDDEYVRFLGVVLRVWRWYVAYLNKVPPMSSTTTKLLKGQYAQVWVLEHDDIEQVKTINIEPITTPQEIYDLVYSEVEKLNKTYSQNDIDKAAKKLWSNIDRCEQITIEGIFQYPHLKNANPSDVFWNDSKSLVNSDDVDDYSDIQIEFLDDIEQKYLHHFIQLNLAELNKMSTVYLDTETTGLNPPKAEIVEITIIDDEGNPIIDTLVKPLNLTSWPQAQRIHHISPAMVADAPTLDDIAERVKEAVKGKTVVIYNAGYDTKFLPGLLDSADSVECCMLAWSKYKGEWSDYRQSYKWFKLSDAAAEINYQWQGEAHRALADTLATRAVWDFLNK